MSLGSLTPPHPFPVIEDSAAHQARLAAQARVLREAVIQATVRTALAKANLAAEITLLRARAAAVGESLRSAVPAG